MIKNDVINKVNSFRDNPAEWFFGDGLSPTEDTINTAIFVVNEMFEANLSEINCFLAPGGQIQINGYYKDNSIKAFCNGAITHLMIKKGKVIVSFLECLQIASVKFQISQRGKTWAISDSFDEVILTLTNNSSKLTPFSIQPQNKSQSLIPIVSMEAVNVFASSSTVDTTVPLGKSQYSWISPRTSLFRQIADSGQ